MFLQKYYSIVQKSVTRSWTPYVDVFKQALVFLTTFFVIFWLSVFIYVTFYYYFVPVVIQEKPVYFHFSVCDNGVGICSFPQANISLAKDGNVEVFKPGQRYNLILELEMPESERNQEIGMFMIEMRLYNHNGETIYKTARTVSASLQYKSGLLTTLDTMFFSPFYLLGYMQQKQAIPVELSPDYVDNLYNPCSGIVLEIQNRQVHLYTARFKMFAQFSGLRYFLYYWPITSAILGISWHFILLSFITLLSWYTFLLPWKQPKDNVIQINMPNKRKKFQNKDQTSRQTVGPAVVETFGPAATSSTAAREEGEEEEVMGNLVQTEQEKQIDMGLRFRRPNSLD